MAVSRFNKKASELAFSTIVLAVISIFILVLIVLFVSGNFRSTKTVVTNLEVGQTCESLGGRCLTTYEPCDESIDSENYNCYLQKGQRPILINAKCEEIEIMANLPPEPGMRSGVGTHTYQPKCYIV